MEKTKLALRWICFFPAGILGALLLFTISQFVGSLALGFVGINPEGLIHQGYSHSIPYLMQGAAFIFIVSTVAPFHHKIVAYIGAGIAVVHGIVPMSLALLYVGYQSMDGWAIIGLIFELLGVTFALMGVLAAESDSIRT